VLTFDPDAIIPGVKVCSSCGFFVLKGRKVIASSHSLSSANEDVAARLSFEGSYGQIALDVRGVPLSVHWRKSDTYGLVFGYYEAEALESHE
jgi:hypothetical protein